MSTTNTTDIYAPGAEHLWEREVRAALNKVRPGMGEAAEFDHIGNEWGVRATLPDDGAHVSISTHRVYVGRNTIAQIWTWDGALAVANNREPIGAICLALCEYRRQVEGVTT
jgi:hypothetical protein